MKKVKFASTVSGICLLLILAASVLTLSCAGTTPVPSSAPATTSAPPAPAKPATPANKSIELSLATIAPNLGSMGAELTWLSQEVAKRTNGAVTIKVFWAGSLAAATEMPDGIKKGTMDIAHIPWPIYAPSIVPLHTISTQCLGYRGSPLASWIAMEKLASEFPEFNAELAANNMVRLTYNGNYSQGMIMSKKPLRTLADFKGTKLAATSMIAQNQFKAVGAVPVFMTVQQTLDATQKGVIDGELSQHGTAVRFKTYDVDKFATVLNSPPIFLQDVGFGCMMNINTWNSFTPDVQKAFTAMRAEFPLKSAEFQKQDVDQSTKVLKDNGVELITLPAADNQQWASLVPIEKSREDWIQWAVQNTKITEARLREIMARYLALYDELEKTYPPVY